MTIWAIGDIQGCYQSLQTLLRKIDYRSDRDQLWLVGDLVNRGGDSLKVLKLLHAMRDNLKVILGNHDLNLLALSVISDEQRKPKKELLEVLHDPHAKTYLNWLRKQPLFYQDKKLGWAMVHAGLPPQWSCKNAKKHARKIHKILSSDHYRLFLLEMYGNHPSRWEKGLEKWDQYRVITNALTRIRMCDIDGNMDMYIKGPPQAAPKDMYPWYAVPGRKDPGLNVVFGHWSALGLFQEGPYHCIDTGCVWGGQLTALNLDDKSLVQFQCRTL
ncbi:MAG: symmetrical bis(5'-nucleosyl)-tetraphosphatase [bacterium]